MFKRLKLKPLLKTPAILTRALKIRSQDQQPGVICDAKSQSICAYVCVFVCFGPYATSPARTSSQVSFVMQIHELHVIVRNYHVQLIRVTEITA